MFLRLLLLLSGKDLRGVPTYICSFIKALNRMDTMQMELGREIHSALMF